MPVEFSTTSLNDLVVPYTSIWKTKFEKCKHCKYGCEEHGWLGTQENGRIVCPGDAVVLVCAVEGIQGWKNEKTNSGRV